METIDWVVALMIVAPLTAITVQFLRAVLKDFLNPTAVDRKHEVSSKEEEESKLLAERLVRKIDILESGNNLEVEWLNFSMDTEAVFLKMPALMANDDPFTKRYLDARYSAFEECQILEGIEDKKLSDEDVTSASRAVKTAWERWDEAKRHAVEIGMDDVSSEERVALRRSKKIIDLMNDPSSSKEYRKTLLNDLVKCVKKLKTVQISTGELIKFPELTEFSNAPQLLPAQSE